MADLNNQLLQRIANSLDQLVEASGGSVSTGSAATEMEKTARAAAQSIEKVTREVNRNLSSLARQIPLIGNALADSISTAVGKGISAILGRTGTGAGVKGLFGAIAVTATAVANEFTKISKAQAELARQTGFFGDKLTNIRTTTTAVYRDNLKYGLSMSDVASSAAALTTSLGTVNRITTGLVQTNAQLAKFAGTTAESMSGLTSTLVRGFNMTNTEVNKFTNLIAGKAVAAGMNASLLIRDMATNSNLVSMHTQRGAEYLSQMAKYSGATGIGFEKMQGISDIFLNMETGAEMAQKINMYTGGMLNSQLLFNKALKGDTLGIFKEITNAFRSPKGIQMINEFPGAVRKLSNELGLSFDELRKMATMSNEQLRAFEAEKAANDAIQQSLLAQQTTLQRIGNEIRQVVLPTVTKIAEIGFNITKGIFGSEGQITASALMGMVTGLAGIGGLTYLLSKGSTRGNPTYVEVVGGGGFAPAPYLPRDSGDTKKPMGRMAKTLIGAASFLPFIGSIFTFYEAFQQYQSGNTAGAIASGMLGLLGLIPGAGFFGKGIFKGAQKLFGKAAMGSVVSSPSLFMVGEENRKEVIVPTERIRQGLPVSPDVAAELSSIGVPGYARGGFVVNAATRSQFATEGGQGVYRSSGSLAEIRRRQQEMTAVNNEYKRIINQHHEELMDLEERKRREDRRDASILRGEFRYSSYEGPRSITGVLKGMVRGFKDSVIGGVKDGYNIWKQQLDMSTRQWVNTGEGVFNFVKLWRDEGRKSAISSLIMDQRNAQAFDHLFKSSITDLYGGLPTGLGAFRDVGGSSLDSMSLGLRQYLYATEVGGLSKSRGAALGLGTYLGGVGSNLMQGNGAPNWVATIFNKYFFTKSQQEANSKRAEDKLKYSQNYVQNRITTWDGFTDGTGLQGGGITRNRYSTPIKSLWHQGYDQQRSSTYNRLTGLDLVDSYTPQDFSGGIGGSPFSVDSAISAYDAFDKKIPGTGGGGTGGGGTGVEGTGGNDGTGMSGTNKAAIAGMAIQGVGTMASIYGTYGWNRQGARAALGQQGIGSVGSTMLMAAPLAGPAAPVVAAIGMGLMALSFIAPSLVPKSTSENRAVALADLQKTVSTRDIANFSKSGSMKKALEDKSSESRTIMGIMTIFSSKNLSFNEAANLARFLTLSKSQRMQHADRFYWNKRLFNVTEDQASRTAEGRRSLEAYRARGQSFKELQERMETRISTSTGPGSGSRLDLRTDKEGYTNLLRRVNEAHNMNLKVEDFENADGTIREGELIQAVQSSGFDLQNYIVNSGSSEEPYTGPGSTLQGGGVDPALTAALQNLNQTLREQTANQTVKILIDGQELLARILDSGNE